MARVLVAGGGFGGLAAATRLRELLDDGDEVVLVAASDRFAMGFAKLWDLAGTRALDGGTRSLHDLSGRGIRFVHDRVTDIDATAHRITVASGARLDGDALVVALGAAPAPQHRALLSAPGAFDLYDPTHLPGMREALAGLTHGRVVISILGGPFKCPPAPYEAALIVDQLLRDRGVRDDVEVVVTTPQPIALPAAGVDASAFVASHLDRHGVTLRAGRRVAAVHAETRQLTLTPPPGAADDDTRDELPYDLLFGVPADTPPPVLAGSGVVADSGWIEPDPHTLRVAPGVHAVGDCTRIATASGQLPHAGVFAATQGEVAARNTVAELTGAEPTRFDGHGYCFLELPGEQVAFVEGDFYADPPDVTLTPPDHHQFLRKQAYERDHLDAWFG